MKLLLVESDHLRWFGVTEIDGGFYSTIIWPGSATEDWQAVLMPATFVELTPSNKLTQAIERAKEDLTRRPREMKTASELNTIPPDVLMQILDVIKGK